jgi:hypothetical protein
VDSGLTRVARSLPFLHRTFIEAGLACSLFSYGKLGELPYMLLSM